MDTSNLIKAIDLRVGNILNYTTAEGDVLPSMLDWQDLKWISEDPKGFNLVHDGIPLTQEWLVKLGFIEMYRSKWRLKFDHGKFGYIGYDFELDKKVGMVGYRYYGHYIKGIDYVHQLQNLMASLGQELEVKP